MKVSADLIEILSTFTNRDDAGRHFVERYSPELIIELEEAGLIEVRRPIHEPTGRPYFEEHWFAEVTELGQSYFD